MEFAAFDPLTASDKDLIAWCEKAIFISGGECFEGLVRPASHVVIKIGSGVTKEEAQNQTYAYNHLKHTDLQVPQVYRYFSSERHSVRKGYLMMEYIPGRTMEECLQGHNEDEVYYMYAQRIFEAACTLSNIPLPPLQPPGPVGGGEPRGYLFHENGCRTKFDSIQSMNNWLNKRLQLAQDPSSKIRKSISIHEQASSGILDFQNTSLVMIHGDLAPRNFIVKDDSKLALVDWTFAGFYPKELEAFSCMVRTSWDPILSKVSELLMGTKQLDSTFWKLQSVRLVNFVCLPEDLDSSLPVQDSLFLIDGTPSDKQAQSVKRSRAKNPRLVDNMEEV